MTCFINASKQNRFSTTVNKIKIWAHFLNEFCGILQQEQKCFILFYTQILRKLGAFVFA